MTKQLKKTTELEEIAYHEAGHAVMAYLLHRRFHSITIDPEKLDEGTGGLVCLVRSRSLIKSLDAGGYSTEMEKHIRITLAGEVSSGIFSGQEKWDKSQIDIGASFKLVQDQCYYLKEADAYINWLLLSVQNDLKLPQNWCCVCAMAQALLDHKTINYRKARETIKAAYDEYNLNPSSESSLIEDSEEFDGPADIYCGYG